MDALIIGFGSAGKRHAKILKLNKKIKKIYIKTNQKIKPYNKFIRFNYKVIIINLYLLKK